MEHKKRDDKPYSGLTFNEVQHRKEKGDINKFPKNPSRTFGEIIRANLFTIYNAINFILAIIVIIAGSPKNALFAGVIITNTLIGIVQELRAKKTLEKLSVINNIKAKVVRDGEIKTINAEEIVLDDVLILNSGMQVLVDAEVLDGTDIEMDESMLTGESDTVMKKRGDNLLSGSFVSNGYGYARVKAVGGKTYAARLSDEAKKFKLINSELITSVNKILKIIIWVILPMGILLLFTQIMMNQKNWRDATISSVAGIIGMVPEGLILLTSLTFVVAIARLSKWNTLVQELPATEVLARVDTLCLDKTGTITEGKLKLRGLVYFGDLNKDYVEEMLSSFISSSPSNNQTSEAILENYKTENPKEVVEELPFSSGRKWSAVKFKEEGIWILGAPENIMGNKYEVIREKVESEAEKGSRVLLFLKYNGDKIKENLEEKNLEEVALILIEDIIREEAPKTLAYFEKQGVNIKIISGDNPLTVSSVAKRAGVKGAEKYIDAREIDENKDISKILEENVVFGRVTPHQKKNFVKALQSTGHIVAMTGDGINDVLALKESDCGIAMANGSDATKAVAQLVLLDSNFSSLPQVVLEGRRTINNLERVANLYLSKTVYSLIMAIIFCFLFMPYPIMPIQLGLIGAVSIGIPSFFLAMSPNDSIVKKGFLSRALSLAIPNGIFISICTVFVFLLGRYKGLNLGQCRTLAVIIIGGCSLSLLLEVSKPLTRLKILLNVFMSVLFIVPFFIPIGRKFYMLYDVKNIYIIISVLLVLISPVVVDMLKNIIERVKIHSNEVLK
ncbi:cation-translocating P-type ATPase [Hathewaya massiliensis]|uniref:cation-translocating P-type ATPase n=1 Tax=Hathewaya massiliensis TaxID=1964382 RepID=UPI0011593B75|nr:cation-translocating P-type ATPase [Hathewaya massiliensis]